MHETGNNAGCITAITCNVRLCVKCMKTVQKHRRPEAQFEEKQRLSRDYEMCISKIMQKHADSRVTRDTAFTSYTRNIYCLVPREGSAGRTTGAERRTTKSSGAERRTTKSSGDPHTYIFYRQRCNQIWAAQPSP